MLDKRKFFSRLSSWVIRNSIKKTLFLLSLLVPEKRGLIVFSMSKGRYWDNSRALFEFMAENEFEKLSIYWLSDPELSIDKVPEKFKNKFIERNSIQGWYLCSRSQVAILSHGIGDFGVLGDIAKKKKLVMLWHAITTKYCGILDRKLTPEKILLYKNNEAKYYDLMIGSSDVDRYYTASYTGVDVLKIKITGLPRNDKLIDLSKSRILNEECFNILYAPTFRDYKPDSGSVFVLFQSMSAIFLEWLRLNKIRFYLRSHVNDSYSIEHIKKLIDEYPDIFVDGGVALYPDVSELIIRCKGLVTDYSSVYIDALLLDMPVIFVDYDKAEYMKKRGLAYDYELITPGPKVVDQKAFMLACEGMMSGASEWADKREAVRTLFFKYQDSNSCSRVAQEIINLCH